MRWFEDLTLARVDWSHPYLVTEEEIVDVGRRWDPQPFHTDPEAAARSIYGGLTASSLHLFAICTRLFFDHDGRIAVLAMLGKDEVRFPNAARADDELVYHTECVEHRASRTKPDRGIVVLSDTLLNGRAELVLSQKVSLLVARQSPR